MCLPHCVGNAVASEVWGFKSCARIFRRYHCDFLPSVLWALFLETEIWLRCWASWPYNFLIFSTWLSILPFFCSTFREISSILSSPFNYHFLLLISKCPFNFPNVHLFLYLVPCLQSFSSDPWEHVCWLSFLLPANCFFQFVTCFDRQHSDAWPSANI